MSQIPVSAELLQEVIDAYMEGGSFRSAVEEFRALLASPQDSAGAVAPRPTGLSPGWNLVRQCDGFVIGHSSDEPKESHKAQALIDGRVYVPFMATPQPAGPAVEVAGEREAFEAKYEQAKAVVFEAEHNRYVPRHDSHWQRQCAEAMTPAWRAFQAGATWQRRQSAGVPDALFDGYAVLQALSDKAKQRTSAENVSDVLDAVVGLMRSAPQPVQQPNPDVARLREALERIADTDPDEGTSWFHDVANAALAKNSGGETK